MPMYCANSFDSRMRAEAVSRTPPIAKSFDFLVGEVDHFSETRFIGGYRQIWPPTGRPGRRRSRSRSPHSNPHDALAGDAPAPRARRPTRGKRAARRGSREIAEPPQKLGAIFRKPRQTPAGSPISRGSPGQQMGSLERAFLAPRDPLGRMAPRRRPEVETAASGQKERAARRPPEVSVHCSAPYGGICALLR